MERATRLRRYLRKDYSQLVDFPVEIVGRDGQVRRYSFDDSVRLYHRRIHSAPMRYDDGELVDAEVRHCRNRIEQLRRSYLEHFGWGVLRGGQLGGLFGGPLAAEVAAFLRRAFAGDREGPTNLRITLIDSAAGDTFYLRCSETGRSWILYAWRFDGDGATAARDAWRGTLERLSAAPVGDNVERLLLGTEGPDYALALAGTGEWDGPGVAEEREREGAEAPDPLHAGLRALYDGHLGEALRTLEAGLDAAPSRLGVAQATALVALLEDETERAEFAARFGRLHHPGDPLLTYLLGVALLRAGRRGEASDVVGGGARGEPLRALVAGVLALRRGDLLGAWRALGVAAAADRELPYAARTARLIRGWLGWSVGGVATGLVTAAAGVVVHGAGEPAAGMAIGGGGLALALGFGGWLVRRAVAVARGERLRGVPRLVSLELLPRDRELEGHH